MDILKELTKADNYQLIFEDLRSKASQSGHRRRSAPVNKELPLSWILNSEEYVTDKLIKELKNKTYAPQDASKNLLFHKGKEREIYALCWPDKIVESVLAQALNKSVEHLYSDALYSFRRGKSNLMALGKLADFIKAAQGESKPIYIFKTDIQKYGDNIKSDLLLEMIRTAIPQQEDYLWQLLRNFLGTKYREQDSKQVKAILGLPAGFSLTPVCENIYLQDLDQQLIDQEVLYLRFGDDLLLAGTNPDLLLVKKTKILNFLATKELTAHPDKTKLIALHQPAPDFQSKSSLDYLGYSINAKGELFLSSNKLKILKSYFRNKLAISFHTINKLSHTPEQKIKALIRAITVHYQQDFSHPYLQMILAHGNDLEKIRQFDQWIAAQVIKKVYKQNGARAFRHVSYQTLRSWELPSLLHNTRLNQRSVDVN